MMKKQGIVLVICGMLATGVWAQTDKKIKIDGEIVTARVEDGDTLILAHLDSVSVTTLRSFTSDTQYRRYLKYRRYANQVYPYAVQCIKIFREVERDTKDLKKRQRKKHIRQLQKDLKTEFMDPLKGLSRTQGKILIKMIEHELDATMFDLLKSLRGGLTAAKWQSFGKMYGYDLKQGYLPGEDLILDAVIRDFDISYTVD
ncbi:MAG: DUF4294 domain-containing protein [Saprospiraceae bacterium]|nr:DUF4294 domain-containing protein [Saprospiraceae bacterium]